MQKQAFASAYSAFYVCCVGLPLRSVLCPALCKAGKSVLVLEASDGVGGRVRSDVHPDGYIFDRGFQIFLSGYPEAQRVLDYEVPFKREPRLLVTSTQIVL